MKLVFIYGPPAVGKLTVARELAQLTGFRLFHNHLTVDLVGALFEFGAEPFVNLREQIWLSTFHEAAQHDVSLIFTFAPEKTVREQFIQNTQQVVADAGGEVVFVELTCDPNEIERRIESPSRKEFGKLSSLELYRQLKAAGVFQSPSLSSPDLTFETTTSSPQEIAQMIARSVLSTH